jgi:hypothetical protein
MSAVQRAVTRCTALIMMVSNSSTRRVARKGVQLNMLYKKR